MLRRFVTACAALGLAGLLPAQAQQPQRLKTETGEIVVETVARGLDHPWGLAFLPDGRMLVTERAGRLRIVSTDGQVSPPLGGVPRVYARDQGGLLDVALDPKFSENRLVYLTYAEPREGGAATAAGRGRLKTRPARRWRASSASSGRSRPSRAALTSVDASPSRRTASCSSQPASASSSTLRRTSRPIWAR